MKETSWSRAVQFRWSSVGFELEDYSLNSKIGLNPDIGLSFSGIGLNTGDWFELGLFD